MTKERKRSRKKKKFFGALDRVVEFFFDLLEWIRNAILKLLEFVFESVADIANRFSQLAVQPNLYRGLITISWLLFLPCILSYYEMGQILFGTTGLKYETKIFNAPIGIDFVLLVGALLLAFMTTLVQTAIFDDGLTKARMAKAEHAKSQYKKTKVESNAHPLAIYHANQANMSGLQKLIRNQIFAIMVFVIDGASNTFPLYWNGWNVLMAILCGGFLAYVPEGLRSLGHEMESAYEENAGKNAKSAASGKTVDAWATTSTNSSSGGNDGWW